MQLAALGLFVFERATIPFEEQSRRADWKHARTGRVGARDASQFLGPGTETISIAGMIVPEAAGSFGAIETLREMADQGDAWPFILGTGQVLGNFVILSIEERKKALLDNGLPRAVDFALELGRVDD